MNRLYFSVLCCLALSVAVPSCTHTVNVYEYKYDSILDHVFIKKGVDFSHYQSITFDEVSVWHPTENGPPPERIATIQANLAKTQELFSETLTRALADRYEIRTRPGRHTLRLEVQFIDLRALPPGSPLPPELERLAFRTQPGHITMVARLFDARSKVLLARAADLGKRASAGGEAPVDWEAVASDFDYWARVFRAWLDENRDRLKTG